VFWYGFSWWIPSKFKISAYIWMVRITLLMFVKLSAVGACHVHRCRAFSNAETDWWNALCQADHGVLETLVNTWSQLWRWTSHCCQLTLSSVCYCDMHIAYVLIFFINLHLSSLCLLLGYRGGSPTAVQRPCPLWELSPSHPILL